MPFEYAVDGSTSQTHTGSNSTLLNALTCKCKHLMPNTDRVGRGIVRTIRKTFEKICKYWFKVVTVWRLIWRNDHLYCGFGARRSHLTLHWMCAQGSVGFRWRTITGPYHANFSQVETQKFDPHWFYCLQWGCNNLFCQECISGSQRPTEGHAITDFLQDVCLSLSPNNKVFSFNVSIWILWMPLYTKCFQGEAHRQMLVLQISPSTIIVYETIFWMFLLKMLNDTIWTLPSGHVMVMDNISGDIQSWTWDTILEYWIELVVMYLRVWNSQTHMLIFVDWVISIRKLLIRYMYRTHVNQATVLPFEWIYVHRTPIRA